MPTRPDPRDTILIRKHYLIGIYPFQHIKRLSWSLFSFLLISFLFLPFLVSFSSPPLVTRMVPGPWRSYPSICLGAYPRPSIFFLSTFLSSAPKIQSVNFLWGCSFIILPNDWDGSAHQNIGKAEEQKKARSTPSHTKPH